MKTIKIACDVRDHLPLEELLPLQGKLKTLSKKDHAKLRKEILETGFAFPFMMWKDKKGGKHIIDGHQRLNFLTAIKSEGYEVPPLPVVYVAADSIVGARRRILQYISTYGKINQKGLAEFMHDADITIEDLGQSFSVPDGELNVASFKSEFFDPTEDNVGAENEIPIAPKKPKTKLGDVYALGSHRLMCGDSTNEESVKRLLKGEKPLLMVTDPPYGVKLDQTWRDDARRNDFAKGNKNVVANDDRADWFDVWRLCGAQIAYVWHASAFSDVVMQSLRRADFEVKQQIIWNKSVMTLSRQAYHWKHEPCWYAVKKGCNQNWKGDRTGTTVWDAASPAQAFGRGLEEKTDHPTQKPIILYEIPIENHTDKGDLLYEPFSGSGSAFIAAEKHGRRVYGMELDPVYCDIVVARWEKFSGKKAVLQSVKLKKK